MRAIATIGTVLFLRPEASTVPVSDPHAPMPNVPPAEEKPLSFILPPAEPSHGELVSLSTGFEGWLLAAEFVQTTDGNFTLVHDVLEGRTGPKPGNCQFRDRNTGEVIPDVDRVASFRYGDGTANCSFPDGTSRDTVTSVYQYDDKRSYWHRGAWDTWVQCSDFVPKPWTGTTPRSWPFSALDAQNVVQPSGVLLESSSTRVRVTCDEPPEPASLSAGEKAGIAIAAVATTAFTTAAVCLAIRKHRAAARVAPEGGVPMMPGSASMEAARGA